MTTKSNELERIAYELAINSKAAGDSDFGNFGHFWRDLNDDEWNQVCDMAEKLLPTVKPSEKLKAEWRQADRDVRNEKLHELRQLGY